MITNTNNKGIIEIEAIQNLEKFFSAPSGWMIWQLSLKNASTQSVEIHEYIKICERLLEEMEKSEVQPSTARELRYALQKQWCKK